MSSREHQLISRIIRHGALGEAIGWGITPDDFLLSETKTLFVHLQTYAQASQSVIGPSMAQSMFPSFQLCDDPHMRTDALCAEVRKNRIAMDLQVGMRDIGALVQRDPVEAVRLWNAITANINNLSTQKNTDVRIEEAGARIVHEYKLRKSGVDLSLCPWPWARIQETTMGINPSDYIVFYGRPKSMKSWVLAKLAAWTYEQDKRAIVYTKEMGADDISRRIISILAGVDATGVRQGRLSPYEEEGLFLTVRMLEAARARGNLIMLSGQDCQEGSDTVPWLQSKVEAYKPQFVYIDGMYLMSDVKRAKKDHERVMNISRALRQMTLSTKVALCCTLQANRKAAGHSEGNLDEIAFSDAIGQDATHIFRVINERNKPTIAIVTAGGREFDLTGWRIFGEPNDKCNFDQYGNGELSESEIEKAKEHDVSDTEKDRAKNGARKITKAEGPQHLTPGSELNMANRQVEQAVRNANHPGSR